MIERNSISAPRMKTTEQKSSTLLTQDENNQICLLLGHKCQTLATTVVELYTTSGRNSSEWQLRETGVLCLVKDNSRRSYFFRLYCPVRKQLLWEHEVYNNMEYLAPTSFLHTFEAEDCIAGFNFASEGEGALLRAVLLEKIESKRQRRIVRRNRNMGGVGHGGLTVGQQNGGSGGGLATVTPHQSQHKSQLHHGRKDAKKRLTKSDIGHPHNFRHVSHVGWDPTRGFDCENIDNPQLKEFFIKAGVTDNQLQDKETREFIYDFIQRNGGLEAVKVEIGEKEAPPVPSRSRMPPAPPSRAPPSLPPPPPPPPPPLRTLPPRNPPGGAMSGGGEVGAPPPPPPPPPTAPPPPTPSQDDPRSALLQAIKEGTTLRPVDTASMDNKKHSDSRTDLMREIERGVELKSVGPQVQQRPLPDNGLASALAIALAERSKVIHSDSSSTDDDEVEDDDEWED